MCVLDFDARGDACLGVEQKSYFGVLSVPVGLLLLTQEVRRWLSEWTP